MEFDPPAGWLWLLWERGHFLGQAALWGLALSTLVAFLIPRRYESTTRLMPPDNLSSSGMAMMAAMAGNSGLSSLAGDLLGTKTSGALFLDILHSRTVEDRLIDKFDLRRVYWVRYMKSARKLLGQNTEASEDHKSGVISITVTDRDPRRAARIAQAYVEELDRLVAEVSTSSARRERIFIEQRLAGVKRDLDHVSHEFSEYASQNTAVDIAAQEKTMVEGAGRLQGELIAAQSELEGLQQFYTANNVRVRSVQARVDELQRQLDKLGGDGANPSPESPARPSPDPLNSGRPTTLAAQPMPSIRKLPLLGVRWADLYRETKIQETVYELLTQQYELAKIQEAKEIPVVKVLDAADIPETKSFPPRGLIIVLGGVFSCALGSMWVLGPHLWAAVDSRSREKRLLTEIYLRLRSRARSLRSGKFAAVGAPAGRSRKLRF